MACHKDLNYPYSSGVLAKQYTDLALAWSQQGDTLAADLNRNGTVDFGDLAILAEHWLCE